jgi:ribosomal protein S18 acetylase RimI-like enzyme
MTSLFGVLFAGYAENDPNFFKEELPTQQTLVVKLTPENVPGVRKDGPACTNFHISFEQTDGFTIVGKIETKLYLKHKGFGNHMRIAFMSVQEEYRNKVIGTKALTILINHYRKHMEFTRFVLEAAHWDTGFKTNRVPFYMRLGFTCLGYVDEDEDENEAMIMSLEL